MRRLPILLIAAAIPVAAQSRFSEVTTEGCGAGGGTMSVGVGPRPMNMHVEAGKPYSGHETGETIQTLPNGAHIVHQRRSEPLTWRDSHGRVREERRDRSPCLGGIYRIEDPVAGYYYVVDPINRVAHRVRLEVREPKPPEPPTAQTPTMTKEPLGTKTISGIKAIGTKTTRVYPAGSRMGNDAPVTTVREDWVAPSLNLEIYAKESGPGDTDSITEIKDLSTDEPDPALFKIPEGYKVVDETKSFTITIPAR
jgi:hypothetical protein